MNLKDLLKFIILLCLAGCSHYSISPVRTSSQEIDYINGVPSTSSISKNIIVALYPITDLSNIENNSDLDFYLRIYNKSNHKITIGIEDIVAYIASNRVKIYTIEEMVEKLQNAADWEIIAREWREIFNFKYPSSESYEGSMSFYSTNGDLYTGNFRIEKQNYNPPQKEDKEYEKDIENIIYNLKNKILYLRREYLIKETILPNQYKIKQIRLFLDIPSENRPPSLVKNNYKYKRSL